MHTHRLASMLPNYGKRAKRAVSARNKLAGRLSPTALKLIDEKQLRHGFRWAARTALTELGIKDAGTRTNAIKLAEELSKYQKNLNEIEQNKSSFLAKKPTNPNYPNGYIEAVTNILNASNVSSARLISLFKTANNANTFLERLFYHQKNLGMAWEKQEEFLKLERKTKF